ncbi:MAG: hypothetical protein NTV19_00005 [Burkholderiales bacterium]|nr:hypothetical protein [Burkholderiales bacterium]
MSDKLDRLLRYHRQRVFDHNGDLHERAIRRLKATPTAQRIFDDRRAAEEHRASERWLYLWA